MPNYQRITGTFLLLVVAALLCVSPISAQASAYQNWTGVWVTNQGVLKLQQEGKTVSGAYCSDSGLSSRVKGTLADEWGFTLRGQYYEGIESGLFEFRITDSNQKFRGWRDSANNEWVGNRAPASYEKVRRQTMTVINNSPHHITAIFVSPADAEDWQEVLAGQELRLGAQRNVVFNIDSEVCLWDIRIVESGGAFTTFQSLKINPDFTSINYFYKNGIGTFHFGVG